MAPDQARSDRAVLGVLMLDTRFPRLLGDIGNPRTFDFAVRYEVVRDASPQRVVRERDPLLLQPFIAAGHSLVRDGATAITTSCGFLVLFQQALQEALTVPVWTSSLLLLPQFQASLPSGRAVGVVTVDAAALGAAHLRAAGADAATPVEGLAPGCAFQRCLLNNEESFDAGAAEQATVAAALRLVERRPDVAAIVFECTNMPPYAQAVRAATGRAAHDITTLISGRFRPALRAQ